MIFLVCAQQLFNQLGGDLLRPSSCTQSTSSPTRKGCTTSFQWDPSSWQTTDALVDATILAMQDGSLKQVGILLILDSEVLASLETLLKVNLTLRSLWACMLILIKQTTSRCKTERMDNGIVPYGDIPEIRNKINKAVDKLWGLLANNKSNYFLAVFNSGSIVTLFMHVIVTYFC